ncbi:MAG: hypothetical protein BWY92_00581 [Firmicutes bacterium ADurb.BinA052]|nr:MAG: hypothetical protein BWY92_00581 [Firmicutes bacterium ADurb.BinA052]
MPDTASSKKRSAAADTVAAAMEPANTVMIRTATTSRMNPPLKRAYIQLTPPFTRIIAWGVAALHVISLPDWQYPCYSSISNVISILEPSAATIVWSVCNSARSHFMLSLFSPSINTDPVRIRTLSEFL